MPSPESGAADGLEQGRRAAGANLKAVLDELDRRYPERTGLLQQAALALLAREHLLVFGPPGTGKSELAAALLRRFVDEGGRPSLYARQIVETTVQTDLVGPVDFKTLTETGRTVYHLDEGLLSSEHAVLDEVFDGRDLLLRSILSVLNERELALGPVVHKARLQTGILTTNRYLSEILNARPETLLAFTDRIAFACFVPKGFASPASREVVLRNAAEPATEPPRTMPLAELRLLRAAAREVRVPEDARAALASLVDLFSKLLQDAARERKGYAPSCFLSPRTLVKSVGVLRAAVVLERYVEGRDRPLQVGVPDLARLRWMFALGGPLGEDLSKVAGATPDAKEKWQLENVRLEAGAFERAMAVVSTDYQRRVEAEAKAMGLPELRARARDLTPAAAPELALLAFEAGRQTQSEVLRAELDAMTARAADAFAAGARAGILPALPAGERITRLRACLELSRRLAENPDRAGLSKDLARHGSVEAVAALAGAGAAEAGAEFEERTTSLSALTERAVGLDRQLTTIEELGRPLEALAAARPLRPVQTIAAEARRRIARSLRRRAMVLLGGTAREAQGWRALAEHGRVLEELDKALERLSPGEGKVRSHVLSARAGVLLAGELDAIAFARLAQASATLKAGLERMEPLGVEAWRALRVCRPAIERRLTALLGAPRSLPPALVAPNEEGYQSLLGACSSHEDRRALHELAQAALMEPHPLVLQLDARLAELDLHELSAQVSYLARWLDDVMAGVPEPAEIRNLEEANAVWAHVSATRFFAVGWRDRDLALLQERLAHLCALPALAEDARRLLSTLEAVAATADRFGRALLERRAELVAA